MGDDPSPFLWSDTWVLLSLIYAGRPASRELLRQVGDAVNHAIMTDEELEGGLQRLVAAGYATDESGLAQPTPAVLTWYEKAGPATRRYIHADWKRVQKFLKAPDWSPQGKG